MTIVERDYFDKLRNSYDLSRKYRRKVSYQHATVSSPDEADTQASVEINRQNSVRRPSVVRTTKTRTISERSFDLSSHGSASMPMNQQKSLLLAVARNKNVNRVPSPLLKDLILSR
jgi:hypothetical protein